MSYRPEWGALLLGTIWVLGSAAMFCRTDDAGSVMSLGCGGYIVLSAVDLLTMRWGRS